ncbi:trimethylamine-N-oxide reductase TorA [Breoghania sp.]|uniref:trimethylamine-N-oxide reductase TorA n=1 Tax=Breoghania sp. TaxID=2065378 RepID=UPI002AAB3B15|nr:trimethylamine-N-oxide reductase TorA [Breoghania sp.]
MTDMHMKSPSLTRRRFLTASSSLAALGFAGSIMPMGMNKAFAAGDQTIQSACHWGIFNMSVKDGRAVSIEPWEKDPHPSPQLPGVLDSIYSPTRIRYPMVRRSYLENGGPKAERDSRGTGDFVRVSWDKAIELVAAEIKRVQDEQGPSGIFAGSYGWKSPGKFHNCRTLLARAMNTLGGYVGGTGDYSTGAAQVIMPHVVGGLEVYSQQTSWPLLIENTDTLVFWGADPVKTCQIDWLVPEHGVYDYLKQFKETGKKIICIDPYRSETAQMVDADWIAPKPHTDVAMMLGIAHTVYSEGLHDEEFLSTYCYGFDMFVPYLTGESDGTPKTAEWAAEICGVPADKLKELARLFAGGNTMLASGWSLQRIRYGEQSHWMLVTLAAMLGQIGTPGGGFGLSYHYCSGGTPTANGVSVGAIGDGKTIDANAPEWLASEGAASIPVARIVEMLENPGGEFDFNGKRQAYPDTKLVYWVGGNPFCHHQDRNRMIKAWKKVETFIVHDFQWTATARHADIVLPATTSYERNDMEQIGSYSNSGIVAMKKVVEPIGEARNDFDIFAAICAKLGKEQEFTEGKSEMEWLKGFFGIAESAAKAKNLDFPNFDDFWKEGLVLFDVPQANKEFIRFGDFVEDPLLNPLGTPTGLIEIYSKAIERMQYDDCPAHPTYFPPEDDTGPDYPMQVNSAHPHGRLHSQLCGTSLRETYAINGREPCVIHPDDAAARGISDGDIVRVFNTRGQVLAGVRVSDETIPGVIRLDEGGWYSPSDPSKPGTLDAYGDVNVLTFDVPTSKLGQGNCGHSAFAQIEKFEGTPPEVTVFSDPAAGQ